MKVKTQGVLMASVMALLMPLAAWGQTSSQPNSSTSPNTPKPPATAAPTAPKPAASTSLVGVWTGQVQETGRNKPFAITITIDAKGATTDYPEQGCAGKLTRIGASGAY